jgi:hypothetical protein
MSEFESEVVSVDTGEPVDAPATPKEEVVEEAPETPEVLPEESTETDAPADTVEDATDDGMVTLPDGRKLPPKEAEKEYRNLYSEFTRKSQRLSNYEKASEPINNQAKPDQEQEQWVPETWEEVLERSKQEIRADFQREQQEELASQKETEDSIVSQLDEIKTTNPNVNENQLFSHAIKYGFRDLKAANSNMNDMQKSIKKATDMTAQNIQKRNADPISGGSEGGNISDGDVYDPSVRNMSAVDYLNSLN